MPASCASGGGCCARSRRRWVSWRRRCSRGWMILTARSCASASSATAGCAWTRRAGPTGVPGPARCGVCAQRRASERARWTRARIIEAIGEFERRYGHAPTASDWNPNQARRMGQHARAPRALRRRLLAVELDSGQGLRSLERRDPRCRLCAHTVLALRPRARSPAASTRSRAQGSRMTTRTRALALTARGPRATADVGPRRIVAVQTPGSGRRGRARSGLDRIWRQRWTRAVSVALRTRRRRG